MSNTAEKIRKILNEIEPAATAPKTAKEIAGILLGCGDSAAEERSAQQETGASVQQGNVADLPIFDERMRLVNELWEIAYYRPIYSCRPLIGNIIVFFKRVFRKIAKFLIEPIVKEQIQFNSAAVNALNAVRNNDVVFDAHIVELHQHIAGLHGLLLENQEKFNTLQASFDDQQSLLEQYKAAMTLLQDTLAEKDELVRALQSSMEDGHKKLDRFVGMVQPALDICQENKAEILALWEHLQADSKIYADIDYFEFENYFRGNRLQIKESQRMYLPYFSGKQRVLDLGSGRGEFLELLKENQICGIGVEPYGPFVDYCRTRGQEIVQEDAVAYLRRQEDASYGGIFAAQLAEHLSTKQLIEVCKQGYRVLETGGVMILETPNPTCLSIYVNAFYMDPSHVKPVHPKTLEYFLKKAGFVDIRILYTEQSKVCYSLPLLDTANSNLAEFNDGINFLSDIVFGSQDYAIIAVK